MLAPIGAVMAFVGAWMLIPRQKYTARATFFVSSQPTRIIFKTNEVQAEFTTYLSTQVNWIKSQLILKSALNDPEVAKLTVVKQESDPIGWLEKSVQVSTAGEILRITLTGPEPEAPRIIVNAVARCYEKLVVRKEQQSRIERHQRIQHLYEQYESKLEAQRASLRKLSNNLGSNDQKALLTKQQGVFEQLATAERELMQVQSELRSEKAAELADSGGTVERRLDRASVDAEIKRTLAVDPDLIRLRQRVSDMKRRVDGYKSVARRDDDPSIVESLAALNSAKRNLKEIEANKYQQLSSELLKENVGAERSELDARKLRLTTLREHEKLVNAEVKRILEESQALNVQTMDLQKIQDDISHADVAARILGDELESLSVELEAESRVRLIELADRARTESKDKRLMMSAIGSLGGFGLILFTISFLELRSRKVCKPDEVVEDLGLSLVGTLPALPKTTSRKPSANLEMKVSSERAMLIESVDATRAVLVRASRVESLKVVMISMLWHKRGRLLSSQLALSLAGTAYAFD